MPAANSIAPSFGFLAVIALYGLNQTVKKPLVSMAVGPVGAIAVGLIINILYLTKMYVPALGM